MENNYENKSTDKRNVFLERVNRPNNIFEKFSLGVKTPQDPRKEWFWKSKDKSKKNNFLAKF